MKHFTTEIITNTQSKVEKPATLCAYIPDNTQEVDLEKLHPAVVILPGGGYGFTSDRENEAVALKFISEGVCAFVLKYNVAPVRFPVALCEALLSIKYVRDHAEEFHIDKENISVCGFSAGGHLAASTGVHWNNTYIKSILGDQAQGVNPNKLILSYPVITSGEYAHRGSFDNLLGESQSEKWLEFNSLEKQVSKDTPPTFIWHTYEDDGVPVENTMMFATELIKHKIPTEVHVYRRGKHGLSIGNHIVSNDFQYGEKHVTSDWIDMAIRFLYD